MTNQTIIELLARREGWTWHGEKDWERNPDSYYWKNETRHYSRLPRYLESLDALQPVLATLSHKEWGMYLIELSLLTGAAAHSDPVTYGKEMHMATAEQRATCMAKAISPKETE